MTLSATGQEIVSDPAISLSLLSPAAIAVVVAELMPTSPSMSRRARR